VRGTLHLGPIGDVALNRNRPTTVCQNIVSGRTQTSLTAADQADVVATLRETHGGRSSNAG